MSTDPETSCWRMWGRVAHGLRKPILGFPIGPWLLFFVWGFKAFGHSPQYIFFLFTFKNYIQNSKQTRWTR